MRAKNQAWRTALAGAWLAAAGVAAEGSPPPPPMLGQAAPPFELRDVRGGTVSLASLRGRFLVLHFGASWWPFCNAEAPHLKALQEKYGDRGVQALIIDVMEPEATAAGWAERWQFPFPVLLDTEGKVAESYAPRDALPDLPRSQVPIAANLIIDREGKVRFYTLLDSIHFDARLVALQAKLDALLAASPAPVVTLAPPAPVAFAPGRTATARLSLRIRPGFHVQANPSEPYLVPLTLALRLPAGVRVGAVTYPPGRPWRLAGSDRDLSVYTAELELAVALEAGRELASDGVLEGDLSYQACDDRACLRPASVPVLLSFHTDNADRDGAAAEAKSSPRAHARGHVRKPPEK